jgi:hypothetical protein
MCVSFGKVNKREQGSVILLIAQCISFEVADTCPTYRAAQPTVGSPLAKGSLHRLQELDERI